MLQKVGRKEKLAEKVGRREIYPPVPPPSKVEVNDNDQGNRTTPTYVVFTETERLNGDSAKNQATLNPSNTFDDLTPNPTVQSIEPKLEFAFSSHQRVWYHGPKIRVHSKGALKTFVFYPRENGFMVLKKMKKNSRGLLGTESH